MTETIIKRDGRKTAFELEKISKSIARAFHDSNRTPGETDIARLTDAVVDSLPQSESTDVDAVYEIVFKTLKRSGLDDVADSYAAYHLRRCREREKNSRLMRIYDDITNKKAADSDIKRENANINGDSAMGAMLRYGSEGAKEFNELFVLKPEHARAHHCGDIHIHDMDFLTLTTTCCQIDLIDLFRGGFSTGHGYLREPNDIISYSALACIAIQANQNDQHGGQSIVNFDYAMAEGVKKTFVKRYRENMARAAELIGELDDASEAVSRYTAALKAKGVAATLEQNDAFIQAEQTELAALGMKDDVIARCQEFAHKNAVKETDRATYQAMEALIHNLNTMNSRAGAQVPFSSINYGMDTSPEARMVMRNLLLATERGLGNGETPIFPIQIFRVKEGINFNPGEPNYDLFHLACRVSSKRLFPNFSFQDAPYNLKYYKPGHPETEVAYMGCRTRVVANVYDRDQEITYRRGNLSFTSINLPRIAIRAKGDMDFFWSELDRLIDLTVDQLMARFRIQAAKHVYNSPFLMGQGVWLGSEKLSWNDEVGEVLKHGTLSVGFIGLAETLKALTGKHHGESEDSQALGLKIIGHMRRRCDEYSEKLHMNVTLLATPAEGLSGRFVRMDREIFGSIEGVTNHEYYTNSFHIPVYFPISAAKKIRLEAPYHELTNAGHISYVEMDGDASANLEAFERIVRYMKECGIGYGSINHPVDRDPVCGYNGIIGDTCPQCGRAENNHKFERIRRITGYLVGTLDRFNNAKRAEESERVKHSLSES